MKITLGPIEVGELADLTIAVVVGARALRELGAADAAKRADLLLDRLIADLGVDL